LALSNGFRQKSTFVQNTLRAALRRYSFAKKLQSQIAITEKYQKSLSSIEGEIDTSYHFHQHASAKLLHTQNALALNSYFTQKNCTQLLHSAPVRPVRVNLLAQTLLIECDEIDTWCHFHQHKISFCNSIFMLIFLAHA